MDHSTEAASLIPLPNASDFDADPASFSASTWLNQVLSAPAAPALSTLVDSMADALRESHETLDESLRHALKAVPWVVRESERVRQRANALRTNVDAVGNRVATVETGVVSSVKTIADADTVVRRVQETVALLETASNADVLLERLESLLASAGADGADLVAAADVVSQLRKALQPLHGVSEMKDRFTQLEKADARLEKLAAPQLLKALEARNKQAAVNARIVFDHAGRENAFLVQYANMRGSQVRQLWSSAWLSAQPQDELLDDSTLDGSSSPSEPAPTASKPPAMLGDLAAEGAETAVRSFYDQLAQLISVEADWLEEAFPDLKMLLLPTLVCDSLDALKDPSPRANVFVPPNIADPVNAANGISDRLFSVALCSVAAAAKIGKVFLPDTFGHAVERNAVSPVPGAAGDVGDSSMDEKSELFPVIANAITSLLMPYRKFWESVVQTAVRQARTRAEAIKLNCKPQVIVSGGIERKVRPALTEIARDVETCAKETCAILDACLSTVNARCCGVGIDAMKQASGTISSIVSDRLLGLMRLPASGQGEDEWTRLNGALRLLMATSGLKRGWDSRKETGFAVAIGTATPMLEAASVAQDVAHKRIRQFLGQVEGGNMSEAGIVWELGRNSGLTQRVVSEFESLDVANDLQTVVDTVQRVVYDAMFHGVTQRFASFNRRELWSGDGLDGDGGMAGFSSSPLRYATEVADYLMTIPQQLEPFVPDEEDARYATPSSVYMFSKGGKARGRTQADEADGDGGKEEDTGGVGAEDANRSFAGMWISVLSIGTMELYVEKICNLAKLSEGGTRQLATDADYMCNVAASLGVVATVEMALVCRLLECKKDSTSFMEAAEGYDSAEHRKLIRRVAAVRGINVTL